MEFTGEGATGWEYIGSRGFSSGAVSWTSLYGYNGTLYVAFCDETLSDKTTVMEFTGEGTTGWEAVGSRGFSSGMANYISLYVHDGTPYVAYRDFNYSYKAIVKKYTGEGTTGWETVGNEGFTSGAAGYVSLYVSDGIPYVACCDSAYSDKVTVMKFW